jgi:hypothetical protein
MRLAQIIQRRRSADLQSAFLLIDQIWNSRAKTNTSRRSALTEKYKPPHVDCYDCNLGKKLCAAAQEALLSSSSEQLLTCATNSEISFTYAGSQRLPR